MFLRSSLLYFFRRYVRVGGTFVNVSYVLALNSGRHFNTSGNNKIPNVVYKSDDIVVKENILLQNS